MEGGMVTSATASIGRIYCIEGPIMKAYPLRLVYIRNLGNSLYQIYAEFQEI